MAAGSKSGIGAVIPVFLMGVTLCITSFACTAPFLGSMLAAGVITSGTGGYGRLLLGMETVRHLAARRCLFREIGGDDATTLKSLHHAGPGSTV